MGKSQNVRISPSGSYVFRFDNTYSVLTGKQVGIRFVQ
jgi:hypothetical protein